MRDALSMVHEVIDEPGKEASAHQVVQRAALEREIPSESVVTEHELDLAANRLLQRGRECRTERDVEDLVPGGAPRARERGQEVAGRAVPAPRQEIPR